MNGIVLQMKKFPGRGSSLIKLAGDQVQGFDSLGFKIFCQERKQESIEW